MYVRNATLGVSGLFYILQGLWWHLQVTKKFWSAQHRHTSFSSSVTYNCCNSLKRWSVEGLLKLLFSVSICAICFIQITQTDKKTAHHEAIGQMTVFTLFAFSGLCDILTQSCQKFIFPNLDYLVLVFCFNLQSVVLGYHTDVKFSWMAMVDTYSMISATAVSIAILLEFKFPGYVWCCLMRAYCTVVLGTWLMHILIYNNWYSVPYSDSSNTSTALELNNASTRHSDMNFPHSTYYSVTEDIVWVPMFFAWHMVCNLIMLTLLWLLTYKCTSLNCCCCVPGEDDNLSHFENRVHFDYHVISRMTDSDFE